MNMGYLCKDSIYHSYNGNRKIVVVVGYLDGVVLYDFNESGPHIVADKSAFLSRYIPYTDIFCEELT